MSEKTEIEKLKKIIIENMEGRIVDHEARKDSEIVEFYADVFCLIATEFSTEQQANHKEELKQAVIEAHKDGFFREDLCDELLRNEPELQAEAIKYYEANHDNKE